MREIYSKADPILYESRTRSIRMHGVLTTIRLENLFWEELTAMAARESTTTNQLVARLHDEVVAWRGESVNFASFLRVCCLRHLSAAARTEAEDSPRLQGSPRRTAQVATAALRSVG